MFAKSIVTNIMVVVLRENPLLRHARDGFASSELLAEMLLACVSHNERLGTARR